jgi:hypothetical protein
MKSFSILLLLIVFLPFSRAEDVRSYSELRSAPYSKLQEALDDFVKSGSKTMQGRLKRVRTELKSVRNEFHRNGQTALLKCKPEMTDTELTKCLKGQVRKGYRNNVLTRSASSFLSNCFVVINLICGEPEQIVKIPEPIAPIIAPINESPPGGGAATKR